MSVIFYCLLFILYVGFFVLVSGVSKSVSFKEVESKVEEGLKNGTIKVASKGLSIPPEISSLVNRFVQEQGDGIFKYLDKPSDKRFDYLFLRNSSK